MKNLHLLVVCVWVRLKAALWLCPFFHFYLFLLSFVSFSHHSFSNLPLSLLFSSLFVMSLSNSKVLRVCLVDNLDKFLHKHVMPNNFVSKNYGELLICYSYVLLIHWDRMWDPTSVREENETLLIKVWKPLYSRCVLKSWGWQRYVTRQNWQYLLVVTSGHHKWYKRSIAIRNRSKRTISISSSLGILQMVSEPDTEQCVSKNAGSLREWTVRSHVGWRGLLIRVWKHLPIRYVLKPWGWRQFINDQSRQC